MGATECHWIMESGRGVQRLQRTIHAYRRPGTAKPDISELESGEVCRAVAMDEPKVSCVSNHNDSFPVLSVDRRGLVESLAADSRHGRVEAINPVAIVAYCASISLLCGILWLLVTLHWEVDSAQQKLEEANARLRTVSVSIMQDMRSRFDRELLDMRDNPAKFEEAVKRAEERAK